MKISHKISALIFSVILFSGCGLQDGSYSATAAGPDSMGYTDYLNVTVTDGVISGVEFDSFRSDGQRKSSDSAFESLMHPVTGTTPGEISSYYQQKLLGAKKYNQIEVDAISGATVSSASFSRLWAALETPLKEGEIHDVILPPSPEYEIPAANE